MKTNCVDNENMAVWIGAQNASTPIQLVGGNGEHGRMNPFSPTEVLIQPGTTVETGRDLVFTTDLVFVSGQTIVTNALVSFKTPVGMMDNTTTYPVLINWADTLQPRYAYNTVLKYSRLAISSITLWMPEGFYDFGSGGEVLRQPDPLWGVAPTSGTYTIELGPPNDSGEFEQVVARLANFTFSNMADMPTRGVTIPFLSISPVTSTSPYLIGRYNSSTKSLGHILALRMTSNTSGSIVVPASSSCLWRVRVSIRGYVC
jgi:hypothetical protein